MKKIVPLTGRIEIDKSFVFAEIFRQGTKFEVVLKWDFSTLNFDATYLIVVDLFVPGTTENKRYDLGNVKTESCVQKIDVSKMLNPLDLKVRFKVIDSSKSIPIIHASVDKIQPKLPEDSENSRSLLPIIRKEDLKVPWSLVFDLGVPKLYVTDQNDLYKKLKDRTKSPWFYPLIMHDVFKSIFEWCGMSEDFENDEKAIKWKKLFIDLYECPKDFFDNLDGKDAETREEEVLHQAELIAQNVAARNSDLNKISHYFTTLNEGD